MNSTRKLSLGGFERWFRAVRTAALLGSVAIATSCGDDGTSAPEVECGEHGSADGGVCVCEEGYEGEECDDCAPGFSASGNRCVAAETETGCDEATCGEHGSCDQVNARCECEAGYTGADCSECDEGFHATAQGCEPDDAPTTDECEAGGCEETEEPTEQECDPGYAGEGCSECAAGYHEEGADCVVDATCTAATCGAGGNCNDETGTPVCECLEGYTGADCSECDEGYHAGDDGCLEDEACTADSCSGHGSCADGTGLAVCECDAGYSGATCADCEAGLVRDADGNCSCQTGTLVEFADGSYECVEGECDPGHTGEDCSLCVSGYHKVGSTCIENEVCGETSCSGRGDCDDATGEIVCVCDPGFEGADCSLCDSGLHSEEDGCANMVACETESCSAHGSCDASSGALVCTCDEGYTGDQCQGCATDYVMDDNVCVLIDLGAACTDDTCSDHGSCDDTSGSPVCTCDDTYAGITCQGCAEGYVLDGDGTCVSSVCGDGIVDPALGENCDDGNTATESCPYSPAETSCTVCNLQCKRGPGVARYCGDGIIQSARGESCDDGDENGVYAGSEDAAHCGTDCESLAPYCGDGVVDEMAGEACDDGDDPDTGNSNARPDACRTSCQEATCGDGVVDEGESCDDGDAVGGCPDDCADGADLDAGIDAGTDAGSDAGVQCAQVLTHSSNTTTIGNLAPSCNDSSGHTENGYLRLFSLGTLEIDRFVVTQVRVGISSATSASEETQSVGVRIYRTTVDPPVLATATLIATADVGIGPMSAQELTVPVDATVEGGPGAYLAAEFYTPDGQAAGNLVFIGANADAESDDGYIRAADCGISNWTTMAAIGFGTAHILIHVDGFASGPICEE